MINVSQEIDNDINIAKEELSQEIDDDINSLEQKIIGDANEDTLTTLAAISNSIGNKTNLIEYIDNAATDHEHEIAQIIGLQRKLDSLDNVDARLVELYREGDTRLELMINTGDNLLLAKINDLNAKKADLEFVNEALNVLSTELETHRHIIDDVDNLQLELDNKSNIDHIHVYDEVDGLVDYIEECLNNSAVDLSSYAKVEDVYIKSQVDTLLSNKADTVHTHELTDIPDIENKFRVYDTLMNYKTDEVLFNRLKEQFNAHLEEFEALAGDLAGLEMPDQNVQSDWNEVDETSDAYILNKPSLALKDLNNDDGAGGDYFPTKQYVDDAIAAATGTDMALYLQRAELLRGADDGLVLSVVRGTDIDGNEIFNFVWTSPGVLVTERQIDDAFDTVFGTTAP